MVEPQIDRLFLSDSELDEEAALARALITRTVTRSFYSSVTNHTRIQVDVYMRYVRALLHVLCR